MEVKDKKAVSEQAESAPVEDSVQKQEEYVARKAYEEVTGDMHKFKNRHKEAQARINELEARMKAAEESKLKEQDQWKELYERERQQREEAENVRQQEKDLYLKSIKLSALKGELGGNIKDEYLQFADVNNIEMAEDGSLSSESVKHVANQFRQDHPSLVSKQENVNITSPAAGSNVTYQQPEKSVNEMSLEEKKQYLRDLTEKRLRS